MPKNLSFQEMYMQNTLTPRWLNTRHAADYVEIPQSTFKKRWKELMKYGLNPSRLPSGQLRFDRNQLDRVMEQLRLIKVG